MEILRCEHISKVYVKGNTCVKALDDVSFTVEKGEFVSIVGPSGSGKSTLLRCCNLLEYPNSGDIYFFNQNIVDRKTNLNKLRTKIGMVFQGFHLFENMNVLENILCGLRCR